MMTGITLLEPVPLDYRRLYLFYGDDDFKAIIAVDGRQEMKVGVSKEPIGRTKNDCLDWQTTVVMEIRGELQRLAGIDDGGPLP